MAYTLPEPKPTTAQNFYCGDNATRIPVDLEDKQAIEEPKCSQGLLKRAIDACNTQPYGCGRPNAPGRPVFISHPDAVDSSRPDCYTMGLKGYGRPYQHPLFQTSNAVYGRLQAPPGLNAKKFPRKAKFTARQGNCGNYQDIHFTTQIETDVVYKEMKD